MITLYMFSQFFKEVNFLKTKLCVLLGTLFVCTLIFIPNDKTTELEPTTLLAEAPVVEETLEEPIVFDGLTLEELITKINKFLTSDLENKGELFVTYSLEKGVDPYLAVAISLHETGCKWGCSRLVKQCNNVGGQVGSPSCNGGTYRSYETLDEGIKGFIDNLARNYINMGLTTPEEMNPKYAADKGWASKVNKYIEEIKAK